MGTNQSIPNDNRKEVRGGIKIQLNKLYFVSNEVIQGTLYIRIEEPFQGYFLSVNLQGFEEVNYSYTKGSDEEERNINIKRINNFLNYSMPIYDFSNGTGNQAWIIQPCQFQIPFQLVIPYILPSSMQYFNDENTKCNLKYVLNAQILSTLHNVKPVRGSQEIIIGQRIYIQDLPNLTQSKLAPVICCCCKSGKIEYNIQLESRYFAPSEIIKIKINADLSNFRNSVNNFIIKLVGKLNMSAQGKPDYTINQFEKKTSFQVNSKQVSQEIQLQIPDNALLTTQGQLIQMSYYLQIIPNIDSFCCVTDQSPHEIIIYLNPKQYQQEYLQQGIQQLQNFPVPQNWNPIQLQQAQFNQIQQNQMQQLFQQNLAYEQKLYGNCIAIEPSKIKLDIQQQMNQIQQQNIYQQQIISNQPSQQQQNQIKTNETYSQQQNMYPTQNQNYQLQTQGQKTLLGQPIMKDENKTYL
ncbi:hypothetical protein ABPG74_011232 [Tetrahymena malaccensis]